MKKILLSVVTLCTTGIAFSQCSDLFISEYVEGSYNNKVLEIFNPTSSNIDLSNYRLVRWSNGSTTSDQDIRYAQPLSGTINAGETFLAVLDRRDPSGTGVDTMLFSDLQTIVNATNSAYYSPDYNDGTQGSRMMSFNGDDAISLDYFNGSTWVFVDIFGLIGEQPIVANNGSGTAGWTDTAPYWDGNGAYWTKDQTLRRKYSVESGVTANPGAPYTGAFNPTAEWDSLPKNTFDGLGWHVCNCNPNAVEENNKIDVSVYPNPVVNNKVTISTSGNVKNIEVKNLLGQIIYTENKSLQKVIEVNASEWNKGVYFITLYFNDNSATTKKIIRK